MRSRRVGCCHHATVLVLTDRYQTDTGTGPGTGPGAGAVAVAGAGAGAGTGRGWAGIHVPQVAVSELHAPISSGVPPDHTVIHGFHRTLVGGTHALCVRVPVQERR